MVCSYGYKLVCVDDKFSKPFKTHLDENAVYNFKKVNIAVMWWKSILTKNLWWLKKIMKILRTLLNVRFVTMIMLVMMLK